MFHGVSGTFLELNRGAIVKRRFRKGEIICREGEFGSTAFYHSGRQGAGFYFHADRARKNAGRCARILQTADKHAGRPRESDIRDEEARRPHDSDRRFCGLELRKSGSRTGPGDLFGEMTCMNFYPRSATVRAESEVVAYEMLRNVLDIMLKNKTFRAQVDQQLPERALENHLRGVPMFADLSPDFIEHLKESVELLRFAPGQVIARQGDPADSFYLVRIGFVKISENYPGGELVLAYLSRGDYFGEIGLLGGGVRTAICTALDHVEVVRIVWRGFPPDGGTVPQRAARPGRQWRTSGELQMSSACRWYTACRSINSFRKD